MEVTFTRLALADLTRIRSYIDTFNPAAAGRMAARLLALADDLADHPLIGRPSNKRPARVDDRSALRPGLPGGRQPSANSADLARGAGPCRQVKPAARRPAWRRWMC